MYIHHKFQPNVDKYTSPMDPMRHGCSEIARVVVLDFTWVFLGGRQLQYPTTSASAPLRPRPPAWPIPLHRTPPPRFLPWRPPWQQQQLRHRWRQSRWWRCRCQSVLDGKTWDVQNCLPHNGGLGGGLKHFYVHLYLGKWSNLTNIFHMGWNHQLEVNGRCLCHSNWVILGVNHIKLLGSNNSWKMKMHQKPPADEIWLKNYTLKMRLLYGNA